MSGGGGRVAKSDPGNTDEGVTGEGSGERVPSPGNGVRGVTPGESGGVTPGTIFSQLLCCTRVLAPILWLNSCHWSWLLRYF